MKHLVFFLSILFAAALVVGCVGVTQTFATPVFQPTIPPPLTTRVPGATVPPLPTRIVIPPPATQPAAPQPTSAVPTPTLTTGGGVVITDATLLKLVDEAKADLTTRANVPPDAITVVSAEPVEWRESSLGCPMPGMMYAQVITPGYLIVLEANGETYNYHASMDRVMWCDK